MQRFRHSTFISMVIAVCLAIGPVLSFAQPAQVCDAMQIMPDSHSIPHGEHQMQHMHQDMAKTAEHMSMQSDCCDGDCQCDASLSASPVMMTSDDLELKLMLTNHFISIIERSPAKPASSNYRPPIFA